MNPLIQLKQTTSAFLIALVCVGLLTEAQAVSPAPDGGYPGGNTAEGQNALSSLTTGTYKTAVGFYSLLSTTTGQLNTAIGTDALVHNTTGVANTAVGLQALASNTTGSGNTAIGNGALLNSTTGNDNIVLGQGGASITSANNVICIGNGGQNVSNSCFIGNIYGVNEGGPISAVYINTDGQLGTQPPPSSRWFKKEIKPMNHTSEAILSLKPVTFHYKSDKTGTPQFGLIAEDVAEIDPDLVVHDKDGEIYTVRYDAVNAMLLNEFLKEHKKTEKLEATVASLIAAVKEQAAQIQR